MSTQQADPRVLLPEKLPFILGQSVAGVAFFGLGGSLASIVLSVAGLLPVAALSLVGGVAASALVVVSAVVAQRKERYELHDSFLRCLRGGLVSGQSTDLDIRNITHVKEHLPWLRYKMFGVGDILVESAGSSESVVLRAVVDPHSIYDELAALMQSNGFSLKRDEVLHREQPDPIGVVVEIASLIFGAAVTLFFLLTGLFGKEVAAPSTATAGEPAVEVLLSLLVMGLSASSLFGFVWIFLRYLDLRRRTYTVFSDAVVYEEGFLNRHNAFIPFENIADAETKRTLLDRILGLYDVRVSCQGGGSEVKFRRLRQGPQLIAAISGLVREGRQRPALKDRRVSAAGEESASPGAEVPATASAASRSAGPALQLVAPDEAWTAELKMSVSRALASVVPLALFPPAFLVAAVGVVLKATATKYVVGPSEVGSSYRLLTVDERQFAYEKITGMVVQESLIDRVMGTLTIRLWSIGSQRPLDLQHVRRDEIDLAALRRQIGLPEETPSPAPITTRFGVDVWVRANIGSAVFVGILVGTSLAGAVFFRPAVALLGVGVLVIVVAVAAYRAFYFRAQELSFHRGHLRARTGRLVRRTTTVHFTHVKKVVTTRYPGGDRGRIQIFVAGEQRTGQQKGGDDAKAGGILIPYAFTAHYVEDVDKWGPLIDDFLMGRVEPTATCSAAPPLELLFEARPDAKNGMVRASVLLLLCFPLLPLLPVILGYIRAAAARTRHVAEAGRVVSTWGIFYRSRASVPYDRIDSIRQEQGALHKLFHNGQVLLMTAGSSRPDLILADLPEYRAIHDVIRAHYGRA